METYKQISKLNAQIEGIKRQYKLLILHKDAYQEVARIKEEIEELVNEDCSILQTIDNLHDNRFMDPEELSLLYKQILMTLGFECQSSERNSAGIHEEVYNSTCSDLELKKRTDLLVEKMIESADREKESIQSFYAKQQSSDESSII